MAPHPDVLSGLQEQNFYELFLPLFALKPWTSNQPWSRCNHGQCKEQQEQIDTSVPEGKLSSPKRMGGFILFLPEGRKRMQIINSLLH
jgi:hypothetical protein